VHTQRCLFSSLGLQLSGLTGPVRSLLVSRRSSPQARSACGLYATLAVPRLLMRCSAPRHTGLKERDVP